MMNDEAMKDHTTTMSPQPTPYTLLMAQIAAMRDRAAQYRADAEQTGDIDAAAENGAVYRTLKELHRLGETFAADPPERPSVWTA
jgi:hypothetical protein